MKRRTFGYGLLAMVLSISFFMLQGVAQAAATVTVSSTTAAIQPARPAEPSWPSEIAVMSEPGQYTAGGIEVVPPDASVYINFAWMNISDSDVGQHTAYLYVNRIGSDDQLVTWSTAESLAPYSGNNAWLKLSSDASYPFGQAGTYRVKVVVREGGYQETPTATIINYWYRDVTCSDNQAHLRPYQPDDWDHQIVVSTEADATSYTDVYVNEKCYINFAWINIGNVNAAAASYTVSLYDGENKIIPGPDAQSSYPEYKPNTEPTNAGSSRTIENWEYIFTSSGTHTLTLAVQAEGDPHEYTVSRTINVNGNLNLATYAPKEDYSWWTEPIVLLNTSNPQDYTPYTPVAGDSCYIHYAWANLSDIKDGSQDAGDHTTVIYINGVEYDSSTPDSLAAGNYERAYTPYTLPSSSVPYTVTFRMVVDKDGEITEVNENDNVYERTIWVQGTAVTAVNISLLTGWNLISIPVQPADTAVGTVLSGLGTKYDSVWTYNTSEDKWYKYYTDPAYSFLNDLTDIEPGKAYWIKASQDVDLSVEGTALSDTSVSLVVGWNFVGLKKSEVIGVTTAMSSISGNYDSVWTYNTSEDKWYKYYTDPDYSFLNDLDNIEQKKGYWIKVTNGCTWQP